VPARGDLEPHLGRIWQQLSDMMGDGDGHEHIGATGNVHHWHTHVGKVDEFVRSLNLPGRQLVSDQQLLVHLQCCASRISEHAVHQPVDRLDLTQEFSIVTVLQQRDRLLEVRRP
jgi:hypothetical protein